MITVGGATTANITANCDWERRGVAVYDLSTIQWGSVFDADAAEYEVPKRISDVIGGGYVCSDPYKLGCANGVGVRVERQVCSRVGGSMMRR